ncbi:hypothetical protein D9619_010570 [Psilocybe cf. subviscida]|uniref:Uncharacterized protein n=1 Tax=Psilocybe cf. subviscida TaxID=2480587 RepID=A0A8H5ERY7_9AGAR|nr:hypothetical protein D9619_010570 [Psilocybe cf. subviscida]
MVQAPPVAPGCGGPQCRTVSSIMQSCLLTIIACVWSSAHPNIDGPRDSGWTRLKRKVIRMFYTVLAPETVLYWAVSQWLAAKTIAEKYNEEFATTGEAETAPGSWGNMIAWFRPLARDTTRRGRGQPWSMTHGFFIQMGGFILYDDEYPTEVLDYELLAKLLRNDAIEALTVTERDLEDHSKGDAVSKGIVVLQTTWFMLQCCARMGQRLPLSELEVLTLAFAVLNVAIYALWWNKPQGGDMAICVPLKQAGAEADDSTTPSTNADARGNPSDNIHRPECRRSNDGLPLIPPHEQQPDKRTTHDRRIGWTQVQQLHNSSYFLPFHPLHRGVSTTFFSLCKIMGIFRVELKREELRMPMFYVGASGMDNSVDALNVSAGGMFDRAQNTQIQNATFTINQYGGIVADHPHAVSVAAEYDPSPRESPDVYVDHLLTKNRGYPLWIPSLSTTLPTLNRTLGVSLGDVGMLTPEGGFDFLFNILHDATHPINAVAGVPEGFVPFRQTKGSGHVEFVEWNAGSYLTSPSMVRVDDGSDRLKTILQNRHRETAVLMIPEETRAVRMHVTMPLRKYIEENIAVWYKFVKHTLGREVENGDLRVVYSCRKSSGFGIATAFNTDQREKTQLTFSVDSTWADISGCPYRWSHTGTAEVKAGPSRQENYDISSTEPVRNQCLFVSTIDTKVSAEIWRHIEELGIGIATEAESRPTSDTVPMQDSFTQSPTAETETHGAPNLPASHQYNEV